MITYNEVYDYFMEVHDDHVMLFKDENGETFIGKITFSRLEDFENDYFSSDEHLDEHGNLKYYVEENRAILSAYFE